jgi:hypothetical protein
MAASGGGGAAGRSAGTGYRWDRKDRFHAGRGSG